MIKILFVCMGNVCRSPTAEGVFRKMLSEHDLESMVELDSAGTHGYHIGEAPDSRTQRAAAQRGYDLSEIRARKIAPQDIEYFDLVLAMDRSSFENIRLLSPELAASRVGLFMDYAKNFDDDEVPDPYYGLGQGFDLVLDMVEDATDGLVQMIKVRTKEGAAETSRPAKVSSKRNSAVKSRGTKTKR